MPPMPGRASSGTPPSVPRASKTSCDGLEQVAVPAAAVAAGELAQPGGGEVRGVPVAGLAQAGPGRGVGVVGIGLQQRAAVLGDEPEQHPVDQPQQRPVEVVQLQVCVARIEAAAQLRVGRVGEEPGAEDGDGLLDAVAELVERPLALLGGEAAPLLQAAGRGAAVALDREPGLVAGQVEQHEVGEQLAVEDRLAGRTRRRTEPTSAVESRSSRSVAPLDRIAHR